MNKLKGIALTALSAVIFGFSPILAKVSFEGGSNGETFALLRPALSLPVLYLLVRRRGISMRLTREELAALLYAGGLGYALTVMLLCISYNYVSAGVATTLHFIYPVLVTVCYAALFRERFSWQGILALAACSAGIALFLETGARAEGTGILLALLSGATFAYYIICLDRTVLRTMYYFKLSFYVCLLAALLAGIWSLVSGTLSFSLTPAAWGCSLLVSLLVSVAGLCLFQIGVALIGAPTAAVLSALEPITSVICGALLLGERLTAKKAAGCALILAGVLLISAAQLRAAEKPHGNTPAPDGPPDTGARQ